MLDRATLVKSLPLKSVAAALLFTVFLGPVGLLYGAFWGGLLMIALIVAAVGAHYFFIALMLWIGCCVWGVRAVEVYNRNIWLAGISK
jgi:hypothetical protein